MFGFYSWVSLFCNFELLFLPLLFGFNLYAFLYITFLDKLIKGARKCGQRSI